VFKAQRLVYHSTLGLRITKKRREVRAHTGPGPLKWEGFRTLRWEGFGSGLGMEDLLVKNSLWHHAHVASTILPRTAAQRVSPPLQI